MPDELVVEEFEFETGDPALRGTTTTTLTEGTRTALANLARLVES